MAGQNVAFAGLSAFGTGENAICHIPHIDKVISAVNGKGYILSGCYVTIRRMLQLVGKAAKLKYRPICLPLGLARLAAPYYERRSLRERKPLFFTPYSVSVLASNGQFSHAAASECFAYQPRPMEETLGDMTAWLLNQK